MHHHYKDITDKLGNPQWWDECGVPRYCDFSPNCNSNIYANEIVYMEIACQNCGHHYMVCISRDAFDSITYKITLADMIANNTLHYGDPPHWDCCPSGPTMNSIPLKVVEYWHKPDHFHWKRDSAKEVEIVASWASE